MANGELHPHPERLGSKTVHKITKNESSRKKRNDFEFEPGMFCCPANPRKPLRNSKPCSFLKFVGSFFEMSSFVFQDRSKIRGIFFGGVLRIKNHLRTFYFFRAIGFTPQLVKPTTGEPRNPTERLGRKTVHKRTDKEYYRKNRDDSEFEPGMFVLRIVGKAKAKACKNR